MAEVEGQLRTLFGMGDRALTPQEKKYFSAWIHEFGYGMDVIRKAYDITVDTKGTPKMSYMNSILANWNRDGLRTLPEIEAAQTAFNEAREKERGTGKGKGKNPAESAGQGTFDTEDFFEAAVRRSLGDDFDPTILKPTKK
jgi:DnaD/phage-associated family protein